MTPLEAETAYTLALARLEEDIALLEEDECPEGSGYPGVPEDGLSAMLAVAEAGYAPAQYAYANALSLLKGDVLGGLPWLIDAARQGHADSRARLRELYVHRESVRERMGEWLGADELERMQLTRGNIIEWFFGREEGYNSHFGQLVGILFGAAIVCGLGWYNLIDLAAGLEGSRPWRALWEGMLIRQAGVYFGLCFVVSSAVDWVKPGEGGTHPLTTAIFNLLLFHVMASLLAWGGYELCHRSWSGYRWVPGALAFSAGGLMLLCALLQFFPGSPAGGRRNE